VPLCICFALSSKVENAINIHAPMGKRITGMTLLRTGEPIEASKEYTVAGWASVNEGTEGPAIWDVVTAHLEKNPVVRLEPNASVKVMGA